MSFGCGDSVLVHTRFWHFIDFGMFFSDVLMLSLYYLQVASHFQLPSVLDLSVLFFLLPRLFVFFCADKIANICGGVALSKERFRFSALFMPLL